MFNTRRFTITRQWNTVAEGFGGICRMEKITLKRPALLYDAIDSSRLFVGTAKGRPFHHERMLCHEGEYKELEANSEIATERGMSGIKGHAPSEDSRIHLHAMPIGGTSLLTA
jgi:phosphoserine aminotransferase